MATAKNTSSGITDALAALRSAIGHEQCVTPDYATANGYVSARDYAESMGISLSHAMGSLAKALRDGKVEYVAVKLGRASARYYRAKWNVGNRK